MTESKVEIKNLLMKVKEESEKVGLKPNIQKIKIMTFSPITSWLTDGGQVEAVTDFVSLGFKFLQTVTAAMKLRYLPLEIKSMTNLNGILKSRDLTLMINICLVKAMAFVVVMYRCESWTLKKAENQ